MNGDRAIGLERRDGHDVGRDPRGMTPDELMSLGHVRMSAQQALRLRGIDCAQQPRAHHQDLVRARADYLFLA